MFKQIRSRITLFNTFILIAFLIIFIIIFSLIIHYSLSRAGDTYLENTAQEIITGKPAPSDTTTTFYEQIGSSYIIWNPNKSIETLTVDKSDLVEEAHALLERNPADKSFNIISGNYRVYTESFNKNNQTYTLQVLQDVSAEESILWYFISYLLIFGFIGILILLPISYLLAERSLIPVKQSFNEQKQFVSDASHELRSPLMVIQSSLDVLELKEDESIKDNLKWLDNIQEETSNMDRLISELLLINQVENNHLIYEDQIFNLSILIKELILLMKPYADENKISITEQIPENIYINADENRIRQVVRIFIDNAIKYTPEDGSVNIKVIPEKKNVNILIKDTGMGISKEDLAHIFDRFYRCDNARVRELGGSGLGLNIAQTILNHYKGKITTESEVGVGTEFCISIPIVKSK